MGRGYKNTVIPPTDSAEFEKAVLNAAQQIINDGSKRFYAGDIARHNHWQKNISLGLRIQQVLRKNGYVKSRSSSSPKRRHVYWVPDQSAFRIKKSEMNKITQIISNQVMYLLESNHLQEILINEIMYEIECREDIIIEDD